MSILLESTQWGLLTLLLALAIFWVVFHIRARRSLRTAKSVRAGLDTPEPRGGWPRTTVIVPAHNEESAIATCAHSLLTQAYDNLAIVFVLDRCTDQTAARVREVAADDPRITVIEVDQCPQDWAGKSHAAHIGAQHASREPGSFLLFTDADTEFAPDLVQAAIGLAIAEKRDLLSLLSTLTKQRWFERIVQPVCSLELLRLYPPHSINRPGPGRAFANGQFLLFSREAYDRIGGHEGVKQRLLEDLALARAMRESGGRLGLFRDGGMLRCAMYETFAEFREGWKRIFLEACRCRPPRMIKYALRNLLHGAIEPAIKLIVAAMVLWKITNSGHGDDSLWTYATLAVLLAGTVAKLAALNLVRRAARLPWWVTLTYPIGAVWTGLIFFGGALDLLRRRPVRWGGREYVLEPRYH